MSRHAGVTLVEVLIAIFVTAIGLLALLVLFPVGALNMAQAIKDDRTGHCAADASACANASLWDVRTDSMSGKFLPTAGYTTSFWAATVPSVPPCAYSDPSAWGCTPATWAATPTQVALTSGPSYPVFIDPVGQFTLGSVPLGGVYSPIPRVMPRFLQDPTINPALNDPATGTFSKINQNQQITRWMTMLDDISFTTDGTPDILPGTVSATNPTGTLVRETRYSYAYLCRIPQLTNTSVVELTVFVYHKRALQTDASGNPLGETFYGSATGYTVSFPQSNVVTVAWGAGTAAPTVKAGSWILDSTYVTSSTAGVTSMTTPPTGYCYRVVNVSDPYVSGTGQAVDLELQTNFRAPYVTGAVSSVTVQPAIVLLDDVAEVFDMGTAGVGS